MIWFSVFEQILRIIFASDWNERNKILSLNEPCDLVSCSTSFDFPFNGSFYSVASEFCVSIQFLYNFNGIHKSSIWVPHYWWYRSLSLLLIPARLRFHFVNFIFLFSKSQNVRTFVRRFFRSDWHISNWKLMKSYIDI